MSEFAYGMVALAALIACLLIGLPVALSLALVSVVTVIITQDVHAIMDLVEVMFGGLGEFTLVSVPMFILMGAVVSASPIASDLFLTLNRWTNKLPGSLIGSNIGACALFAALSGSSVATAAAIGKIGIPEMRKHGYSDDIAAGAIAAGGTLGILIPPSVTLILYGISTETSIGQLFLAGIVPGIMLAAMFLCYGVVESVRKGYGAATRAETFDWNEKVSALLRASPFIALLLGVLYSLYGGIATPSEAAGVGVLLALLLAVVVYRQWQPRKLAHIFDVATRESVMVLLITGAAFMFSYLVSRLYVGQTLAAVVLDADVNRWVIMLLINIVLLGLGLFLPPPAIIVMTAPIIHPLIIQSGFDPVWFGIVMTINLELGLITPPVGLNLFVIQAIAPDIKFGRILAGVVPFAVMMILAIVILCIFPGIATFLPSLMIG